MIVVTGGTGTTGSQVVAALKNKGTAFKCLVRDQEAARAKLGTDVELVTGDLSDPASLEQAFAGADTLYLLCGHSPKLEEMEKGAIDAAKKAGVQRVVLSTGSEKGITADSPSEILQQHYAVENYLKESGLNWTINRPNFFMNNLLNMAPPIAAQNKLITALPQETTISMIHPADVGECAAEMLTGSGHDGQVYYIAGKAVTMGQTVEAMSQVFGRSIDYMQVPAENFKKALEEKGMPDWAIAHQAALMGFVAKGGMAGETDWVQKLTGHEPRSLETWLDEQRAVFSPS
ncbi:MAG: NmrA family NAD(P)-binding protein [Methyloligellaceae bacterium]